MLYVYSCYSRVNYYIQGSLMTKLYIPIFSLTLILSASLLFSVQPMFSKMILPLLGGTPQVWNTAMLFFQVCLLAGYGYAHATTRFLNIRSQSIIHVIMLFIVLFALPFGIPEGWIPDETTDPTLWQLSLMSVTIGAPFFVLAASAPMLQRWFSSTNHPDANNPYFLYGASNLGSMAALFAYPIIIEPLLDLNGQSISWTYGYYALFTLIIASALIIWNDIKKSPKQSAITPAPTVTNKQRLIWLFLSFVPSSLMLGVTTLITTDIASAPLLWVMPLALYVATFIIAFAKKPIININQSRLLFDIFFVIVIALGITIENSYLNPFFLVGIYFALFFSASLMCHSKLVNAKPHNNHLTEFYLIMSIGGALGGVFNAIIVPQLFIIPVEFALIIGLCVLARFISSPPTCIRAISTSIIYNIFGKKDDKHSEVYRIEQLLLSSIILLFILYRIIPEPKYFVAAFIVLILLFLRKTRAPFAIASIITLLIFPLRNDLYSKDNIIYNSRNFFGVIKVIDDEHQRTLMHGTTNHGVQAKIDGKLTLEKTSYYSKYSPIADVVSYYNSLEGSKQKFAVLGLGIGVMACFQKDDRSYDFFEIDPEIVAVAENKELFTFLSDCGSPYNIVLGDARLKIKNKPNETYDLIFSDVFSSDNIPIHILTKEAVAIYLSKITDNGAVAFHISNRYLDLEPILAQIAQELGYELLGSAKSPPEELLNNHKYLYFPSHHVIITKSEEMKQFLRARNWTSEYKAGDMRAWTDQYSNIIGAINPKTTDKRLKEDIKLKQKE